MGWDLGCVACFPSSASTPTFAGCGLVSAKSMLLHSRGRGHPDDRVAKQRQIPACALEHTDECMSGNPPAPVGSFRTSNPASDIPSPLPYNRTQRLSLHGPKHLGRKRKFPKKKAAFGPEKCGSPAYRGVGPENRSDGGIWRFESGRGRLRYQAIPSPDPDKLACLQALAAIVQS